MKPCCARCKHWTRLASSQGICKNPTILEAVLELMKATYQGEKDPVVIKTRFYTHCQYFKQR